MCKKLSEVKLCWNAAYIVQEKFINVLIYQIKKAKKMFYVQNSSFDRELVKNHLTFWQMIYEYACWGYKRKQHIDTILKVMKKILLYH